MTRRWREMGSDFRFPSASHETVKPSSETGLLSRKRERIWCGTEGSNPSPSSGKSGTNSVIGSTQGPVIQVSLSAIFTRRSIELAGAANARISGFIDSHVLGFDHFEEDLRRGIEHPANHGFRTIATPRYSATPSKSYPDGTASPSNIAWTRSGGDGRLKLIAPVANALKIRSRVSGETIFVPAAVGRNSRSGALLRCGSGRLAPSLRRQGRRAPG